MPLLEDSGLMDTPNLDLRESGSCAMDGEADSKNPLFLKSGFFVASAQEKLLRKVNLSHCV